MMMPLARPSRSAALSNAGYANGRPATRGSEVSASTLRSSDSSAMRSAWIRAPWLSSTDWMVGRSSVATAWRKAKSSDSISTACVRRATFCSESRRNTRSPTSSSWRMLLRALRSLACCRRKSAPPCTSASSTRKKTTMRLWSVRSRTLVGAAPAGCGRTADAHFRLHRHAPLHVRARAGIELPPRRLLGVGELRVPYAHGVGPARHSGDRGAAILAGDAEVRRLRHVDVADHPVVDVAAERHDARRIEYDRLRRRAHVERKVEALGGRERIDVMAHAVAIGKRHRRADQDGLHLGHELLADLLDLL